MPLPHPVIPMSMDDYHVMDHRLGWKHEYWDGAAQLSPASMAVTSLELNLAEYRPPSMKVASGVEIRRIEPRDKRALIGLFVEAFDDAMEYVGWDDASYHESAHESMASFFGDRSGTHEHKNGRPEHSFLATVDGELVAALQVRSLERGPIVEPVMVLPTHQRRGLATALLAATVESLRAADDRALFSRCHLGNAVSLAWHENSGFCELRSYYVASHRRMHYRWRAAHFEHEENPEQAAEMRRLAEHWSRIVEEFEDSPDRWDSGFL